MAKENEEFSFQLYPPKEYACPCCTLPTFKIMGCRNETVNIHPTAVASQKSFGKRISAPTTKSFPVVICHNIIVSLQNTQFLN